jgi:hypothetical protein
MSTSDDAQDSGKRAKWWPLVTALIIAGAGYYTLVRGLGSLPPFIALLLIGATATAFHRLIEMLRSVFDHFVVRGVSAIALMLSMLSGLIAVVWALGTIFIAEPNPVARWRGATDSLQTFSSGLLLFTCVLLGALALYQAAMLWRFVSANAFGQKEIEAD